MVEGIEFQDLRVGRQVGHGLFVVVESDVLPGVVEHDRLLFRIEREAVGGLGLIDRVGAQVELRGGRLAVLVGGDRRHDLALRGSHRAIRGLDGLCRLHDVDGLVHRLARPSVGFGDGDRRLLRHVRELDGERVVPSLVLGIDRERLALELLHVAIRRFHFGERVVALLQEHREHELSALAGRPGVHGLLDRVMGGVGDGLAASVEQLEAARQRDVLARLRIDLDDLERRLRDAVIHELGWLVLALF